MSLALRAATRRALSQSARRRAVMAVAMTAVAAAGRRIARGGEGRDGQRDSSDSGSEDSTLHGTSPGVDPERPSPWGIPVSAPTRPKVMCWPSQECCLYWGPGVRKIAEQFGVDPGDAVA